jgi:hypothetical protein
MPLPYENQAVRSHIKATLQNWVDLYGGIPIMTIFKTVLDEKADWVSVYTTQATAAAASASWSSSSTNCATFLAGYYVGPTAF